MDKKLNLSSKKAILFKWGKYLSRHFIREHKGWVVGVGMAQLVTCLLHKHKDLSLNPWYPSTKFWAKWHGYTYNLDLERHSHEDYWGMLSSRPACWVSEPQGSEGYSLTNKESQLRKTVLTFGLHSHVHILPPKENWGDEKNHMKRYFNISSHKWNSENVTPSLYVNG